MKSPERPCRSNDNFEADNHDQCSKSFSEDRRDRTSDDKARKRAATLDEYKKLLAVAPAYLRATLIIAMNTGTRHSEIRLLQWSFIDCKASLIRLPATVTKNKRPRVIPLSQQVRGVLDSLPRHLHGYVITYKGKPLTGLAGVKGSMKSACEDAELPYGKKTANGIVFHDLQRSAKTNMVRAGVNNIYRDLIPGHSLQGMDAHSIAEAGLEAELKQAMESSSAWQAGQLDASVAQTVAQVRDN